MTGLNGFTFDTMNSVDHGIIMLQPPPRIIPERDVTVVSVPGRSGDLIIDNGRYKNVRIPYTCAIFPGENQTLREAADAALIRLQRSGSYLRLEDTYEPDHFRLARLSGELSMESIVEQAGKFTIQFDCKPQRFLKSGETAVAMDAPGTIENLTGETALPLIRVYGDTTVYTSGTLTIGDITVEISTMLAQMVLDCERQDAWFVTDDGTVTRRNGTFNAPEFPRLLPGENAVSWTGCVKRLEIIPRWWTV